MKHQTYSLPMFPLNLILLPGEEMPLRIFEPRYKQLIAECEKSGNPFAVPYSSGDEISEVSSKVELVSVVSRSKNGNMVIRVRGIELFRTLDFIDELPGKLYGGGVVSPIDEDFRTTNPDLVVLVKKLKLNLNPALGLLITEPSVSMLDVARELRLTSEQKYRFITLTSNSLRERFLMGQLRFMEFIRNQELKLDNNFQLN